MLAELNNTTEIDRKKATAMLMRMFDNWELPSEERTALLGLAKENRTALAKYKRGEPIANSRDTLERLSHLFAIHKNLRLLYPQREVGYAWMRKPNGAFQSMSPVQVIDRYGFVGLLMVRSYLDRARGN
jgi:hypothetical protein